MIGIIDYGMGNLRSVQKAFERLGHAAIIGDSPAQLKNASRLILPGVGAFRDAIRHLKQHDFAGFVRDQIEDGRPLLGICLGLQLLFEVSYEDGTYEGLGILPGDAVRFQPEPGLKIPHMGWNSLSIQRPSPLLAGIENSSQVYFVHSYFVRPKQSQLVVTSTVHGSQNFTSMIQRGNLFATQFHPEKSQQVGLQLLQNFATFAEA